MAARRRKIKRSGFKRGGTRNVASSLYGPRRGKDYPDAVPGSSCPMRQLRREDRATGERTLAPTRWVVTVAREGGRIKLSAFRDRKTALDRRDRREDQLPVRIAGYSR